MWIRSICSFIESYDASNNLGSLGQEERKFETKVSIKVLGYITRRGDSNEERPKIIKRETIVEIKLPRERVMLEDEIPWLKKNNKYKEVPSLVCRNYCNKKW